ncbi:hypothetical protein [Psychromonas algicola]|uniref:hypothetical protein n=1 Tax=Psychromonas algicola TaxID=2555642 RepID=UPI0010677776|nr:hypothetical protein [Psychromonas sp. RZ5]TEW50151.1 hypothetical protein E2R67_09810 [Psychromonas sp. RZ5]
MTFFKRLISWFAKSPDRRHYGYMVESKPNPETGELEAVHYSPYYEFESYSEDGSMLIRLVITLGLERVVNTKLSSESSVAGFLESRDEFYKDGLVDWVSEIYFINQSESDIQVKATHIKVGQEALALEDELTIAPFTSSITHPLRSINSVYGSESDIEITFIYKNKEYKVAGVAKRMTVDAINLKYAGQ